MNISAVQNRLFLGSYPQITASKNTTINTTKTNADEKKADASKSKGFSWSDFWDIIADAASIIAGRKTIKGTMTAIKSAYEKIKSWF